MGKYQAYPEYAATDVSWMEVVPSHWQKVRFKNVFCEKKKTQAPDLSAGSISFGNVIFKNEDNLSPETKLSYQEVLAGEFLVNPLNLNFDLKSLRTALSKIDVVVSTGYIVLQSVPPYQKEYLRWLLYQFDVSHMKTLGAGVRQTIGFADIGNSYFLCPTVEEQQKIAAFLDHETAKIDALIEKQQQLIQLLKEKRQAVISHAVTKGLNPNAPMKDSGIEWLGEVPAHWEVKRAKHVSSVFIPQRNKPDLNDEVGIAWITMEDMRSSPIVSSENFVTCESQKLAGSRVLPKGAVIASCVGNFGVAAVTKIDTIINQQLQAFLPHSINAEYLKSLISISAVYFELICTSSTIAYVNQQGFENVPVIVPSSDEQEAICTFIESIETTYHRLISSAEELTRLMQERRTALISAAVTGKIDVRDFVVPA